MTDVGAPEPDLVDAPALPNPWRTIWFSPRRTIRAIIDREDRPSFVGVIALAAVHQVLASLQIEPDDGTFSASRSAMPIAMGVIQLVFGILVGPFLLAFVGGWLGGEGDPADIRQGVAWSYVPHAIGGLFLIPVLIAYGGPPSMEGPATTVQWLAVPFALASLALTVWSGVLHVITLAEVNRFSILRAIACVVILLIPLMLLALIS